VKAASREFSGSRLQGYGLNNGEWALLPVYLVTVLGTSALTVGFIEGVAEATANITKIFSGAISDWLGKRKLLAAIGYGLEIHEHTYKSKGPDPTWDLGKLRLGGLRCI